MNLVVLGRPGSGKGTQAGRLAGALDLELLAASALLRASGGGAVEGAMGAGDLVDDDVVSAVVRAAVAGAGREVLLDGFPRTVAQCEALDGMFGPDGVTAVEIGVPAAEITRRLERRLVCDGCGDIGTSDGGPACPACGALRVRREDDTAEVARRRLDVYELDTAPVLDWFERRGHLLRVDGTGAPDEVFDRLLEALALIGDDLPA